MNVALEESDGTSISLIYPYNGSVMALERIWIRVKAEEMFQVHAL